MADCLAQVWTDPTDYGWCAVSPDGATIVGLAPNNVIYALDVATYTTTGTPLIDRSAIPMVGKPGIDSASQIYWIETPDFSVYRLMRANLDGSSVTTILSPISFSPTMTFTFEVPNLAYDGVNDVFWFTTSGSGGRLRTITKAGVVTNIYSPPSSSFQYHNPLIDSDGSVWHRWSSNIYRTGSVSHTTSAGTSSFGPSFPAVELDLSGNGIVEQTGSSDVYYSWTGSAISAVTSPCTIQELAFGFTPTFWTPDYAGIWYYEPASSSPVVNAHLWGQFVPVEGDIPPLRLYARDDGRSVGGARQNLTATSIQDSPRIRQGSGYL